MTPREHNGTIHPETAQPDFAAFAAAVRTRVAQRQTLPPAAIEGVTRIGRLVQTLRTKQHWSLQTLAAQTGLSWVWLALLEQGMLLPTELTPEAVHKLGQVFPSQNSVARPEVLFHTLAEDLLHAQVPPDEVEQPHGQADAARSTLRDHLEGLIHWVSELWCPPLAGAIVTAAETPAQEHVFYLDEGSIRLTCAWWAAEQGRPAALRIAWHADLTLAGDFWARFTRPDDATAVLAEVLLGSALAGEEVLSTPELGFDPTREPWAVTLLIRETEQ
jgi:transcriptional regulator with XRE-family HTH domain